MTGHIFIEGEIGGEVTVKSVREDIANYPQAKSFDVHFNSGGGDVYEGYAIGGILQDLSKRGIKTTAKINALCASIATYDALSCDSVEMGEHGDFMIHLPTGTIQGTAEDLRRGAAQLDRIKSELINKYFPKVAKKGVTREQLSEMIDKETSMSPQEAEKLGFIDHIVQPMKAVAKLDPNKFNMETVTKKEVEGMFSEFGKKMDGFFARFKPKNIAVTLADGSQINSDAADPASLVGSMLTDEQGAPLPAGTYETGDGYSLVVDETGKVMSADPITADKSNDAEALKKENEALKQQLAQVAQAQAAQTKEVAAVAKQLTDFKAIANDFKTLKEDYDKLKNATFGDTTVPLDANNKTTQHTEKQHPMIAQIANDLGRAYQTSRQN